MSEFNRKFEGLSEEGQSERYHQLALACLEHYPVKAERIDFVSHNAGVAYRVGTPGQDLLLKIAHPAGEGESESPENIRAGLLWLRDLARGTDLDVQQPVPNRVDDLVTAVAFHDLREPFYCSVQHWLDGEHPRQPSPKQAYAIGEIMAKWHNFASQWELAGKLPSVVYDDLSLKMCLDMLHRVVELGILSASEWATVETAYERISTIMQQLGRDRAVWGLIHGDLHHENILFIDDKAQPIDYGSLITSHFAYDLGVTLYHFMYLDVSVRQALVDGYQAKRTPARLPDMAAEAFLCAAAMANLSFQALQPSHRTAPLTIRNTQEFANVFCRKLVDGTPFVLS